MITTTLVKEKELNIWNSIYKNLNFSVHAKVFCDKEQQKISNILQNVQGTYIKIDETYYFSHSIMGARRGVINNAVILHKLLHSYFMKKAETDSTIFYHERTESFLFIMKECEKNIYQKALRYEIHGTDAPYLTFHTASIKAPNTTTQTRIYKNHLGKTFCLKAKKNYRVSSHFYSKLHNSSKNALHSRIDRYSLYVLIRSCLEQNHLTFYSPTHAITAPMDMGFYNQTKIKNNKKAEKFKLDYQDFKDVVHVHNISQKTLPSFFDGMTSWDILNPPVPTLVVGYDSYYYKMHNAQDPYLGLKQFILHNQHLTLNIAQTLFDKKIEHNSNSTFLVALREAIINYEVLYEKFLDLPFLKHEIFNAWKKAAQDFWMITESNGKLYGLTVNDTDGHLTIQRTLISGFDAFYQNRKNKFILFFGNELYIKNYEHYDDIYVLKKTNIPGFRSDAHGNFDTKRNMETETAWFFDERYFLTADADQRNDNMRYLLSLNKPITQSRAEKILDNLSHPYLSLFHVTYSSSDRYIPYLPASLLYLRRYINIINYL